MNENYKHVNEGLAEAQEEVFMAWKPSLDKRPTKQILNLVFPENYAPGKLNALRRWR